MFVYIGANYNKQYAIRRRTFRCKTHASSLSAPYRGTLRCSHESSPCKIPQSNLNTSLTCVVSSLSYLFAGESTTKNPPFSFRKCNAWGRGRRWAATFHRRNDDANRLLSRYLERAIILGTARINLLDNKYF